MNIALQYQARTLRPAPFDLESVAPAEYLKGMMSYYYLTVMSSIPMLVYLVLTQVFLLRRVRVLKRMNLH